MPTLLTLARSWSRKCGHSTNILVRKLARRSLFKIFTICRKRVRRGTWSEFHSTITPIAILIPYLASGRWMMITMSIIIGGTKKPTGEVTQKCPVHPHHQMSPPSWGSYSTVSLRGEWWNLCSKKPHSDKWSIMPLIRIWSQPLYQCLKEMEYIISRDPSKNTKAKTWIGSKTLLKKFYQRSNGTNFQQMAHIILCKASRNWWRTQWIIWTWVWMHSNKWLWAMNLSIKKTIR